MSKSFLIILTIMAFLGWAMWFSSKKNITPISQQLDLKSDSWKIEWIIHSYKTCDSTLWSCRDSSSNHYSSSWWSSYWGWWK